LKYCLKAYAVGVGQVITESDIILTSKKRVTTQTFLDCQDPLY